MRVKRIVLAVLVIAALSAAVAFACVYDPEGRARVYELDFYCEGGGHGCQECTVVNQGGDYMTCVHWNGQTYCSGRMGGNPYTL